MKKNIFIGFLAVLFVPTFAFAATFNGASGDLTTVTVSNVSRNPNSTGSWSSSVNADAGETVAVQIYYRNTSTTETTPNTKVSFTIPSGSATSQSVSGSVRADNASQVGGTATINLSSSQTLTFVPGSFYWLPDQDTSVSNPITVPPGTQTESNLFSGGLELGNIPAAPASRPFQYQGNVIIHLLVGNSGTGSGNNGNSNSSNISLPIVTTNSANLLNGNSTAILNGFLNSAGSNGVASTYFEYGTNQFLGSRTPSNNISGGSFSFPVQNLSSNTTYYFRAVAQNSAGVSQGSILTFTTGNGVVTQFNNFVVTTNPATEIFSDSARASGSYSSSGSTLALYWFEYGTTQNLGSQTLSLVPSVTGNAGTFSGYLLNLSPRTTYFYRAVGQSNSGEISRGSINSFVTRSAPVYVNQVVSAPVQTTTFTSAAIRALTSLSYGIEKDRVSSGETILYKIGWRNENTIPLHNAFLRITLPDRVSFAGGDNGISVVDNRTLFYNIGTIGAGKSGSISFRGALDQNIFSGAVLVLRSDLSFTDPVSSRTATISVDGKVLVENAYGTNITSFNNTSGPDNNVVVVENTVSKNSVASIASSISSFFPQSALGWIGLILLLVIVVALVKTLI